MLDIGLAFLVYLAPFLLLGLLIAVLCGTSQVSRGPRRCHASLGIDHLDASADDQRPSPVLASDVERDEALQAISHAVGEGRLTFDEAERRIEAVLHCRHRHHLDELMSDLPRLCTGTRADRRSPSLLRPGLFAAVTVSVLAAVLAQFLAGLWELWPLAVACCCLWAARPRR